MKNSILLAMSMFVSCVNISKIDYSDDSTTESIIYNSNTTPSVSLDRIIEDYSYVKLETNDNCLIGNIDELLFVDSLIIVVDRKISKSIFVFDHDGKFKNNISHIGNGPNEFLYINHVALTNNGNVCVQDNIKGKLFYFKPDGTYIKSIDNPINNIGFEFASSNSIIFNVQDCTTSNGKRAIDESNFVITDSFLKPIFVYGKDYAFKNNDYHLSKEKSIFKYENEVYFLNGFENNVYQITSDNSINIKYELHCEPEELATPKESDYESDEAMLSLQKNKPNFNDGFIECRDFTYVEFSGKNIKYPDLLYIHDTKQTISISDTIQNPVFLLFNPCTSSGNNTLVSIGSPSYIQMLNRRYNTDEICDLNEGISVDSNPILVFYHINVSFPLSCKNIAGTKFGNPPKEGA